MGKPKPPEPPDYIGAARTQGEMNLDAARTGAYLSNPNFDSPWGSQRVEWNGDQALIRQYLPDVPRAALDQQQAAELGLATTANEQTQAIRNLLNTPFSFGGSPVTQLPGTDRGIYGAPNPDDFRVSGGQGYGSVEGAPQLQTALDESGVARAPVNAGTTAQQALMARINPELSRRRVSMETQLRNQGLVPGGEAYDNAMRLLGETENDALTQAGLHGIGLDMAANAQGFNQAGQRAEFGNQARLAQAGFGNAAQAQGFDQAQAMEAARNAAIAQNFQNQLTSQQAANAAQQQQFGQILARGQFGNTALQQQLAQALTQRQLPINEITALLSGSQTQMPAFPGYSGSSVMPADYQSAVGQQGDFAMQRYQQQVAQRNGLLGGLFGLAAAPFSMFSFGGR